MNKYTLEVCIDTLESARNAIKGGANRLELCHSLVIGGISASPYLFRQIREESDIKIHAMVRPRFGDFLYTDSEFEIMREEIKAWYRLGADGVVLGILHASGNLDMERMKRLKEEAKDMNFTLHRAFDVANNAMQTLEDAKKCGVSAILTSGQKPEAPLGAKLIKELVANSGNIEIMPGNGIDRHNAAQLKKETKAKAFHLSGNVVKESPMVFRRNDIYMGIPGMSEFERWECSSEEIAAVKKALDEAI